MGMYDKYLRLLEPWNLLVEKEDYGFYNLKKKLYKKDYFKFSRMLNMLKVMLAPLTALNNALQTRAMHFSKIIRLISSKRRLRFSIFFVGGKTMKLMKDDIQARLKRRKGRDIEY